MVRTPALEYRKALDLLARRGRQDAAERLEEEIARIRAWRSMRP